ncbi:Tyrosine recombinase XerC [Erwinia aphidicola]|nr:Tyrosine recombinase XerC [Erwinia aphidicola]
MGNIQANNKPKIVDNKPKFTTKRGNTFYVNFRLPSGKFFRQSLGTDSLKEAQISMGRLTPLIPLVQSGRMPVDEFQKHIEGFRQATKRDLDSYVLAWLQDGLAEAQRVPELGRWSKKLFPDTPLSIERSAEEAAGFAAEHHKRLATGNEETYKMMQFYLKQQGISLSDDDDEGHSAASKIEMSRALVYQAYDAFYKNDLLRYQQLTDAMQGQIQPLTTETSHHEEVAVVEQSMSLSEAWSLFVKERGSQWVKATDHENRRIYEVLLHVVGDVPITSITKQDIRKTLDVVASLPKRFGHPYKTMTMQECIDYDVPEEDLISSVTVHKHLKIYSSFFKVFLKDHKDFLSASPTEGIKLEVRENRGGSFSYPEMKRLVSHLEKLSDDDWRKAYFLTLCYTGARRGEIADLKVGQLRMDEQTGRRYIFVEGGKTEHAQRQIPVHKNIEGMLTKLTEGKKLSDRLFPKFPYYTQITDAWVEIMHTCRAPDFNEKGQKRRVHSIRHSFITKALTHARPVQVQLVVGHSLTESLGITARYTHEPTLEELLLVVDGINWS